LKANSNLFNRHENNVLSVSASKLNEKAKYLSKETIIRLGKDHKGRHMLYRIYEGALIRNPTSNLPSSGTAYYYPVSNLMAFEHNNTSIIEDNNPTKSEQDFIEEIKIMSNHSDNVKENSISSEEVTNKAREITESFNTEYLESSISIIPRNSTTFQEVAKQVSAYNKQNSNQLLVARQTKKGYFVTVKNPSTAEERMKQRLVKPIC